ncbi:MAG: hypothetical protein KKE73_10810 [Proteobacteria bacterium]|nr:hypothetical protein [Pseudomonadota bacterium]
MTTAGNLSAVMRAKFWEAECRAVDRELALAEARAMKAESRTQNLSKRMDRVVAENGLLHTRSEHLAEENRRLRNQRIVEITREELDMPTSATA